MKCPTAELIQMLADALPYVEEAADDPCNKDSARPAIRARAKRMRAVIEGFDQQQKPDRDALSIAKDAVGPAGQSRFEVFIYHLNLPLETCEEAAKLLESRAAWIRSGVKAYKGEENR